MAALAAPAQAYIYWSDDSDNTIARATLDGVQVQQSFIQGVSNPGQVVVDASHIYWFNRGDGAIGRANIDGSGVNADFIPGAAAAGTGLAVGDGYIFWTDFQNSTLGRANVDGSGAGTIVTGLMSPRGVAVDAGHVYWTNYGTENGQLPIGRANLDGTEAVNDFILAPSPGTGQIGQMVADSSHLYWGHGPSIARATSDGTNINTGFAVAPGGNAGLAVDASHIYWSTNGDYFFDPHPIARANIDGSASMPCSLTTNRSSAGSRLTVWRRLRSAVARPQPAARMAAAAPPAAGPLVRRVARGASSRDSTVRLWARPAKRSHIPIARSERSTGLASPRTSHGRGPSAASSSRANRPGPGPGVRRVLR